MFFGAFFFLSVCFTIITKWYSIIWDSIGLWIILGYKIIEFFYVQIMSIFNVVDALLIAVLKVNFFFNVQFSIFNF